MPPLADAIEHALRRRSLDTRDLVTTGLTAGVLPSAVVASILQTEGIEVGQLMTELLPVAAAYARPPISGFRVGAVALGMPPTTGPGPGSLYLGANLEFSGEALSLSVHGEQAATALAWLHDEQGLRALAVNAAPCGYCRQFLFELATAAQLDVLLVADEAATGYTSRPLADYLPDPFGPHDLGVTGGLMAPQNHGLRTHNATPAALAALAAANASYAPYSKDYCGLALMHSSGAVYAGRYAENAAFNPSMSPLQSALTHLSMSLDPGDDLAVTGAVMVEAPAPISQESATRAVLRAVAPGASLSRIEATLT